MGSFLVSSLKRDLRVWPETDQGLLLFRSVVHLIDSVLVNLDSNPAAAESVAAIAATASATVDPGVGPTPAAARRNVLVGAF